MKSIKTLIISLVVLLAITSILFASTLGHSENRLLPEPPLSQLVGVITLPEEGCRLFYYEYKKSALPLDGEEAPIWYFYCALRRLAPDGTASSHPYQVGIDFDGDGEIDPTCEMWVDEAEDGLNGNEITYAEWLEKQALMEI